ncbi:MAG: three-Cys-motif partner protein TcmP [Rhodocyclales bacterium]|nr:three-Cys-motif partner protein TcmP [Rhodocyclales bacterium]
MAKYDCSKCPVGGRINPEDQTCSVPDPDDGLPLACVGSWAEDKHARVRKYVDISRATRRMYITGTGGATFIELFCGPGRARIRNTTRIVDGSTLVAAKEAQATGTMFTELHIADANASFVNVASQRLARLGVQARTYAGRSEDTVKEVARRLNKDGLHLAFLDPFDLKSLPFEVIRCLAGFKRMDMIIHVSLMDLQRNLEPYIGTQPSPLDIFAPGWRTVIDLMNPIATIRRGIFDYWLSLIRNEDMQPSQGIEKVTGLKNQPLYWLVFVARHELAMKFWDEIRNVSDQQQLGF